MPETTPTRICYAGNRPKYWDFNKDMTNAITKCIMDLIKTQIETRGNLVIMSGLAQGVDQLAAYAALKLKVPFEAYVPCKDHGARWKKDHYAFYRMLREKASKTHLIWDGEYTKNKGCLFQRNERMALECDGVVVIWNEDLASGTAHMVNECEKLHKPVVSMTIDWIKSHYGVEY